MVKKPYKLYAEYILKGENKEVFIEGCAYETLKEAREARKDVKEKIKKMFVNEVEICIRIE